MADRKKPDPGKAKAKPVELPEDKLDEVAGGRNSTGRASFQNIVLERG